jgi:hypothetical protein
MGRLYNGYGNILTGGKAMIQTTVLDELSYIDQKQLMPSQ